MEGRQVSGTLRYRRAIESIVGNGGWRMSDWAETMVALPQTRIGSNTQHDSPTDEVRRLMREVAPILWKGILWAAHSQCDSLNQQTGQQILKVESERCDQMVIYGLFGAKAVQLTAEFDASAGFLHWRIGNWGKTGRYELCFGSDQKIAFYDSYARTVVPSSDGVAETLLNALLVFARQ
jgi:hypothetical protein